jgi:hypothetical protein
MGAELCGKEMVWEEQLALLGVAPASRIERPQAPTVPFGVAEVDALTGGLPRGGLTEIYGAPSSGRTCLLLAVMAEATRRQDLCALVDGNDNFDPHSAASAGVDLSRLLWVRCQAISDLQSSNSDSKVERRFRSESSNQKSESNRRSQFARIEQALKAADLLLQAGGFGLVVMDLADVPASMARRIPLTSWFRFRRAVENTATVLLVLEQEPHAKSCASLVLRLRMARFHRQQGMAGEASAPQNEQAQRVPGGPSTAQREVSLAQIPSHAQMLAGLCIQAEVLRGIRSRKPPGKATAGFASQTTWSKLGN